MKLAYLSVCSIVLLFGAAVFEGSSSPPSPEKAKQDLLSLENHWLQVEDDPDALEPILANDFLHVVPVGIITKNDQISFLRKHPGSGQGSKHFEDLHVRIYGNVGIVNGAVIALNKQGTQKTLFTDVFVYREGQWRAVNAQELPATTDH